MQPSYPWFVACAAFVLALAVAGIAAWRWQRPRPRRPPLPDEWPLAARPVFSGPERNAYRQLREALPGHVVLSKLPLVRFCQPNDPGRSRYWYELLGSLSVTFAVCSGSGRVLAAIDLEPAGTRSRRGQRIKESVLAACKVRYLRCKAEQLPTIPELQWMVGQGSVLPAAAPAAPQSSPWPESSGFTDSFLSGYRRSGPPPDEAALHSRNGTTGR